MIKHPSGRPIRRNEQRRKPVFNVPDDGYVTPRLRPRSNVSAIGFHHNFHEKDREDEEE